MAHNPLKRGATFEGRSVDGRMVEITEMVETHVWPETPMDPARITTWSTFWIGDQLLEARDSGFYVPHDGTLWRHG